MLALSDAIIELEKELGTASQPASSRSNSVRDGDLSTATHDAGPRSSTKPNEALCPKKLSRDCTPVELNIWVESFKAYYVSGRLELASVGEQQAYFRACIEAPLVARISGRVTPDTPVLQLSLIHI